MKYNLDHSVVGNTQSVSITSDLRSGIRQEFRPHGKRKSWRLPLPSNPPATQAMSTHSSSRRSTREAPSRGEQAMTLLRYSYDTNRKVTWEQSTNSLSEKGSDPLRRGRKTC